MTHAADGLILPARARVQAMAPGGVTLLERGVRALHAAGVAHIQILSECCPDTAVLRRLTRAGIDVDVVASLADGDGPLVVLSPDVVIDPRAVPALAERSASRQGGDIAAAEASPGTFAWLSAASRRKVNGATAADIEAAVGRLRVSKVSAALCVAVSGVGDVVALALDDAERRETMPTFFHRRLHARSRGLTRLLLHRATPASAAMCAGFLLAVAAACLVGRGGYTLPAAGILTFLLGTLLRHSARDVSRAWPVGPSRARALDVAIDASAWLLLIAGAAA